ncbi:hypothetical protein PM082_013604 [Marasmius tenuissimus]|nr:hypothetical protein PM082_013604 [Marasmius tenuissimus]
MSRDNRRGTELNFARLDRTGWPITPTYRPSSTTNGGRKWPHAAIFAPTPRDGRRSLLPSRSPNDLVAYSSVTQVPTSDLCVHRERTDSVCTNQRSFSHTTQTLHCHSAQSDNRCFAA